MRLRSMLKAMARGGAVALCAVGLVATLAVPLDTGRTLRWLALLLGSKATGVACLFAAAKLLRILGMICETRGDEMDNL